MFPYHSQDHQRGKKKKKKMPESNNSYKKKKKSPLKPKLLKRVSQSFMQRQRAVKLGLAVLGKERKFKNEKALKVSQVTRIWSNVWNKPKEKTDVSYYSSSCSFKPSDIISLSPHWTEHDLYIITLLDIFSVSIGAGM